MKVSVLSRSGNPIIKGGLELKDDASVADLQQAICKYNKKWQPVRQRLTLKSPSAATPAAPSPPAAAAGGKPGKKPPAVVLDPRKRLQEYAPPSGGGPLEVEFKDLGPQVGYQTVFFWEYFGPMVIYPLFYFFPEVLYAPFGFSAGELGARRTVPVQAWACACAFWVGHYAKRIFETYYVHRFSHATMPIANLFRNCGYYWAFAAYVSYFVNHPRYTAVGGSQALVGIGLGVLAELANLYCHVALRNLRPPGSNTGYVIPRGFLFNSITCPNYTAEILAWLGFNIATQTVAGYLFMLAGGYQMTVWALQKHRRLVKLFDGSEGREKYPRRWVIMPPFL